MDPQDGEGAEQVLSADKFLVASFGAVVQQQIPIPKAFELAASESLARAATPETVTRVLGFFASLVAQNQPVIWVLAALLERHASTLDDVGSCHLAVPIYEQIADVFEERVDPRMRGTFRNHRAIALWHLGRHAEALAVCDTALPLLKDHAPAGKYADCLMDRANILLSLGRHAEALAGYDAALPRLREYSPGAHAICLLNRGNVLTHLGQHREALASYETALPVFQAQNMTSASISCLLNHASALSHLGRHAEALAGYDAALPLLNKHGPPVDYGSALMNRANMLRHLGRLPEALAGYALALPLLQEHAPAPVYANALVNRAVTLAESGQGAEAVAAFDEALPLLRDHAPADYARGLLNRANTLRLLGRYPEAVAGFRQTRAALRQSRRLGRVDETSTEFVAHYAGVYDGSVRAALGCGDLDSAYAAVCDGKGGLLTDPRWRLATGSEPPSVTTARKDLTDWLRTQGASSGFHEGSAERTRRYLAAWREHYHAYDSTRPELQPAEELPTRETIQRCLPADWALLDFWHVADDKFLVFVLFPDGFELRELPLPPEGPGLEDFFAKLGRLRDSLAAPQLLPSTEGLLDLHQHLFGPLLPLLRTRKIQGLYLVPHDFLHHLPLHATYEVIDGQRCYLCDEFAIAYLPSAALLPQLPKLDLSGPAFVLANPEAGTPDALPLAQWEGEQLRDKLNVAPERCFLGKAGTFAATRGWAGCGLVHFGCHGFGDTEFSPRSHLRLADDLLLAHDVVVRCEPLKEGALVILNGCQTSVPDDRAVNEGLGLMTAFLSRGASLVLSTQWSVADACAAEMVLEFVEQVGRLNQPPALALRLAQRKIRGLSGAGRTRDLGSATEDELTAGPPDNPVYWAAFQLVGRVT